MNTLYQELKKRGQETSNHESDLYVKLTDESMRLVKCSGLSHSIFTSNIDGKQWIDVPFAFDPFWDAKPR